MHEPHDSAGINDPIGVGHRPTAVFDKIDGDEHPPNRRAVPRSRLRHRRLGTQSTLIGA